MIAELVERTKAIDDACREHRVRRLEVFGSAADGTFDPQSSDLDFLVEYFPQEPRAHYESYFGLLEDLQALFDRKVDLVEVSALRNPYFIRRVNESRTVVYDA